MKLFYRFIILLLLLQARVPVLAESSAKVRPPQFDAAQQAAADGDYRRVVEVLSEVLEDNSLDEAERVVGYANRGIAYSLLGAYGLAKADLLASVRLNPDHNLTLNHLGIIAQHVDDDVVMAQQWFERAAVNGFAAAEVNLAQLYLLDDSRLTSSPVKARQYLESAAGKGYLLAYVPLARLLQTSRADRVRALSLLREAFDAGVVDAGFQLGEAHRLGRGVKQDDKAALDYYRSAAMQGHSGAQNVVGYFYRQGRVVTQDFDEAVTWYQLAADQGSVQAANRLAWLLATCPTPSVCNGPAALSLATSVVERERSASSLDSLAAAYARSGQYDEAIEVVESMLRDYGEAAARYRSRLELYQQGVPFQL